MHPLENTGNASSGPTLATKERFGRSEEELEPGYPVQPRFYGSQLAGLLYLRVQQLDIHVAAKTKDNKFANVVALVQYCKARDSCFKLTNPKTRIRGYVFDVIRESFLKLNLDEVYEQKNEIAKVVEDGLEEAMPGYQILQALIVDIEPEAVLVKLGMNKTNVGTCPQCNSKMINQQLEHRYLCKTCHKYWIQHDDYVPIRSRSTRPTNANKYVESLPTNSCSGEGEMIPGTSCGQAAVSVSPTSHISTEGASSAQPPLWVLPRPHPDPSHCVSMPISSGSKGPPPEPIHGVSLPGSSGSKSPDKLDPKLKHPAHEPNNGPVFLDGLKLANGNKVKDYGKEVTGDLMLENVEDGVSNNPAESHSHNNACSYGTETASSAQLAPKSHIGAFYRDDTTMNTYSKKDTMGQSSRNKVLPVSRFDTGSSLFRCGDCIASRDDPTLQKHRSADEWAEWAKTLLGLSATACYASTSTFPTVANGLSCLACLMAISLCHRWAAATPVLVKGGAMAFVAGVLGHMGKDLQEEYIFAPVIAFVIIAIVVARAK